MKIREVMRQGAFVIESHDTVGAAHRMMTRAHIRHLPVVHDGKLVGMLSERDALGLRARLEGDESWWAVPVRRAMSTPVQFAHPDDSLTEVAGRLAAGKLGAMPIVDHGRIIGIATTTDVLDAEVRVAMAPAPISAEVAGTVMTPFPLTVAPDALLVDAVELMLHRHVRHLPVVDAHGTIVGMLSERDIRTAIGDLAGYATSLGMSLSQPRVRQAMTHPAIVVPYDLPLPDVVRRFIDDRVGALPVVDTFGALLGIVSYVDALRALARPR
jgi:acetoin utilization protein AcuB